MKAQEYEWVSASAPPAELKSLLEALPRQLNELLGDCLVKAMYGWGCNLHMDLCYVPMKVGTQWIEKFIRESLEQRIVVPAESDFYIELPEERLEILFCHEGDIHVCGPDEDLRNKVLNTAPFNSLSFNRRRKDAHQAVPGSMPPLCDGSH
ncbi:MAG: hypothetical protein JWR07_1463 [Nevskia sp.]|nr:hypothetical protein [Nevskia sp.]